MGGRYKKFGVILKRSKKILAIAVSLALSTAAQAAVLNFDSEDKAYSADSNPARGSGEWFGPTLDDGNTVSYNKVNVMSSFEDGWVFGGYSHNSLNVTDNELTILEKGAVRNAIGGFNAKASAMYNTVTVKGQAKNVIGGYTTAKGYARSNSVVITTGAKVEENVLGGYALNAPADSNDVVIDGTVSGNVLGGYGFSGAQSNYVEINGEVKGASYAGYARNGDVLYNGVILNSGATVATIYGAYVENGAAESNFVTVNEGAQAQNVIGAKSENDDVSYNTVDVAGTATCIVGGESAGGKALNNSVTLNSGAHVSESVIAGSGKSQAFGNLLRIKKGADVRGFAYAGLSKNGSASYNYMELSGTVHTAAGGYSENGKADFNYVNVLDGAAVNDVYGGKGGISASHNTLLVKNAEVSGNVYGGQGKAADANIVILSGSMELNNVYGGYDGINPVNAKNVISAEGNVRVENIDGFKVLKLTVNNENIKVSDNHESVGDNHFVLEVQDGDVDLKNKTLVVASHKVDPHENIALLWSKGDIHTDEHTVVEGDNTFVFKRWSSKVSHEYKHELGIEDIVNNDDFIVETVVSDEAKTLSKAFLSSMALIKQGADFIIEDAKAAALYALGDTNGSSLFAAGHGGYTNYDNESEFSIRDYHLVVGGAFKYDNLLWSLFAETGIGEAGLKENADIDTDLSYVGLGTLIDYEFANGLYADAALRFGYIKTDFDGKYEDDDASFVSHNLYGSIHVGGGYRFALNDFIKADVYARYLGIYETSDRFNLHDKSDSRMSVDPSFAHALRAGTEFNFKLNPFISLNAGAGIEHIFDSSVKTFVNGYALHRENIDGTSFVGSLGVDVTSALYPEFSFSSNVHLSAGDRQGAAFSFIAEYKF